MLFLGYYHSIRCSPTSKTLLGSLNLESRPGHERSASDKTNLSPKVVTHTRINNLQKMQPTCLAHVDARISINHFMWLWHNFAVVFRGIKAEPSSISTFSTQDEGYLLCVDLVFIDTNVFKDGGFHEQLH